MEKIFVVGAGTMGNGIAQTAAVSGFDVVMMDVDSNQLEKAKEAAKQPVKVTE
jgi:3-hydroxybutyryl-CoA dehydrogenase